MLHIMYSKEEVEEFNSVGYKNQLKNRMEFQSDTNDICDMLTFILVDLI